MNDFTKEELESMLSTIENVRIYTEIENWDEELAIKIQTMLDNYCEHEDFEDVPVECERYGCDNTFCCCKKCGAKFL
jgi:hypothetical protein